MTKILALDQNMWSSLASARKDPDVFHREYQVLEYLVEGLKAGKLRLPLTQSNIFETQKLSDQTSLVERAHLICTLSGGEVFKGLDFRRAIEIQKILADHFDVAPTRFTDTAVFSHLFWEATSVYQVEVPDLVRESVQTNPKFALFHYLTELEDEVRQAALHCYKQGMASVIETVGRQVRLRANESVSMRRRILSAEIWLDAQDHFWKEVDLLGVPTDDFKSAGATMFKDLVRGVPCLLIQRELRLVQEVEGSEFTENDVRDIDLMCTALPYADVVAAEKALVSRTKQAKLDRMFDTIVIDSLIDLPSALDGQR